MAPCKAAKAHLLPLHRPGPQALQSPQTPSGAVAASAPAQQGASQPRRRAQHPQPPHQQRHPAAIWWQAVLGDHWVHQDWWHPIGSLLHLHWQQPRQWRRLLTADWWEVSLRDHRVHQGWWCPFGGPGHFCSWCCWWALGSCWRPQGRSPPGHALVWHSHRAASFLHSAQAACQDSSAAGLAQLRTACLLKAAQVEHYG